MEIITKFQLNISEIGVNENFNELFNAFLTCYFNIDIEIIAPTIKYASKFFCLEPDFSSPKIVLKLPNKENVNKIILNFVEYL